MDLKLDPTPISSILDFGGKLVDRLWPDPAKAAEAKIELFKMRQSGELAELAAMQSSDAGQASINLAEASSSSLFRSGWRPLAGWTCSLGLIYQYLLHPLLEWVCLIWSLPAPPLLDTASLVSLLFGMLGLGGYRTYERVQGKA